MIHVFTQLQILSPRGASLNIQLQPCCPSSLANQLLSTMILGAVTNTIPAAHITSAVSSPINRSPRLNPGPPQPQAPPSRFAYSSSMASS